jgi:broad specificity phosphatase PhoE
MVQILLIRPGATDFDLQGRVQGTLEIPLSEQGRQGVETLLPEVLAHRPTALYASPSQAAIETAEQFAAALGLKAKTVDKLRNLNQGLWQGMLIDDIRTKQPTVYRQWQDQPENLRPPEGEMLSEASERIEAVLNKLLRKHRYGTIAIVVPEPLATIMQCLIQGTEHGDLWKSASRCATCQVLDIRPAIWRSGLKNLDIAGTKSTMVGNGS